MKRKMATKVMTNVLGLLRGGILDEINNLDREPREVGLLVWEMEVQELEESVKQYSHGQIGLSSEEKRLIGTICKKLKARHEVIEGQGLLYPKSTIDWVLRNVA